MKKLRIKNFIVLTLAGIINAVGVTLFLAPVNLFDSGISGTAFLLDMITPPYLVLGMFLVVLNIPLFIIGFKKLGLEFIVYSIYAIIIYSAFALLLRNILPIDFSQGSPFTGNDLLLSALFGGMLSGVGSGLVIKSGGAIDGVEAMSVLFAKKLGLSVGGFIMIYNVILYTVSAFVFGSWHIPLYSVVAYAVGVKVIDFVVEGVDMAKSVFIITARDSALPGILSERLHIGVTVMEAKGAYTEESRILVYCVVNKFEIQKIKNIIKEEDPSAFMSIGEINETVGGTVNAPRWLGGRK
ncbi:MAG: YitT family protein [Firmicutes bacterium]|nr:YitT family protein [Bacillota bacterium]